MNIQHTLQMKSGFAEAAKNVYRKHIGKSGKIWLEKIGKFAGDSIYVSGGPGSRGFGGAVLTFELEDGTKLDLEGPWHCNSGDMLKDTGVDLSMKHSTKVIISKAVDFTGGYNKTFVDVLYHEEEFVEGSFDRKEMKEKAQQLANELGHKVYFFKETGGGSSGEHIHPQAKSELEVK